MEVLNKEWKFNLVLNMQVKNFQDQIQNLHFLTMVIVIPFLHAHLTSHHSTHGILFSPQSWLMLALHPPLWTHPPIGLEAQRLLSSWPLDQICLSCILHAIENLLLDFFIFFLLSVEWKTRLVIIEPARSLICCFTGRTSGAAGWTMVQ